jgi:hypothetical protein
VGFFLRLFLAARDEGFPRRRRPPPRRLQAPVRELARVWPRDQPLRGRPGATRLARAERLGRGRHEAARLRATRVYMLRRRQAGATRKTAKQHS